VFKGITVDHRFRQRLSQTHSDEKSFNLFERSSPPIGSKVAIKINLSRINGPVRKSRQDEAQESSAEFIKKVQKEVRIWNDLLHLAREQRKSQHFPRLYSSWQDKETGAAIILMEHLSGDKFKRLSRDARAELVRQLENVMRFMWSNGFIHGDLNTGNLIMGSDGCLKLIDFGESERVRRMKPRHRSRNVTLEKLWETLWKSPTGRREWESKKRKMLKGRIFANDFEQMQRIMSQSRTTTTREQLVEVFGRMSLGSGRGRR